MKFIAVLELLIDKPKQGFGKSNDSNIARSLFENSRTSALITEIDEELIIKFHKVQ